MTILYITFGLLAIGLIIFIHEAGHFLAAKKVGVRVDRFALGFDPVIKGRHLRFFCKKWGETEYVIGMIPFGGYVKLAGEIPEEDKPLADDELLAKSVGARALVFVAGAVMNFISAFIFFMIAFAIGVGFHEPRIGQVQMGSPAWTAGIRPSDRVLEIDGEEIVAYQDVLLASALSDPGTKLKLKVERPSATGGAPKTLDLEVTTKYNEARGFSEIGVGFATELVLQEDPDEGTAAHKSGLKKGDRLRGLEINGVRLPAVTPQVLMLVLSQHMTMSPTRKVRLLVEHEEGGERWAEFQLMRDDKAEKTTALRVSGASAGTVVKAIAPDAPLDDQLDVFDEIVAIQGEAVHVLEWATLGKRFSDEQLSLSVRSVDGTMREVNVSREKLLRGIVGGEIHWTAYNTRVGKLPATASSTTLKPEDVIARVGSSPILQPEDLKEVLKKETASELACVVLRGGERVNIEVARSVLEKHDSFKWRTFGPLHQVDAEGPAGKIGVTAGSRILKVGDTQIDSFSDLVDATKELEVGEKVALAWLSPTFERKEAELTVGADVYSRAAGLALKIPEITVKSDNISESFQLGIERSVIVVKQVFLTLRSLFRGAVSPKNLSGPVGITHLFTRVAEMGWVKLLFWMAVVSVNLGVLNLLPFPILDGGHLLFLLFEKIKGSPVSFGVQELVTKIAFVLIISLALFVTFHDVVRLFKF